MKIKTSELSGPALNRAVAQIEGATPQQWEWFVEHNKYRDDDQKSRCYDYSSYWNAGGPIIERECIAVYASGACSVAPKNPDYWVAEIFGTDEMTTQYGPTPLIAAMRCYVASLLGDEVDVPEELT